MTAEEQPVSDSMSPEAAASSQDRGYHGHLLKGHKLGGRKTKLQLLEQSRTKEENLYRRFFADLMRQELPSRGPMFPPKNLGGHPGPGRGHKGPMAPVPSPKSPAPPPEQGA